MRECSHMPGAAKEIACPLCKDLATFGKPMSKQALLVLNQQRDVPKGRKCPGCGTVVPNLVTRKGTLMCVGCAEALDDE